MNHLIFLDNKYTRCYYNIILNIKQENRKPLSRESLEFVYYEKHHIEPKSLGGSNLPENLVLLTAREHFICHLLLTKMTSGDSKRKMSYAFWGLNNQANKHQHRKTSSRFYDYSKSIMQESMSADRKNKSFEDLYGKEKSDKIKENMKYRKTRGPNTPEESLAASNRMKERHRENPWKRFMQTVGKLPRKECPHCNKIMDVGNYGRYHGDKCKLRQVCE
jgi:hypothetical protein